MDSVLRTAEHNGDTDRLITALLRSGQNVNDYISTHIKYITKLIRAHLRSQKELWQQIPWLAYQADHLRYQLDDGFNGPGIGQFQHYYLVHQRGFWTVPEWDWRINNCLYIDCESGELCNTTSGFFGGNSVNLPTMPTLITIAFTTIHVLSHLFCRLLHFHRH